MLIKKLRELPAVRSANLAYNIIPAYSKVLLSQINNHATPVSTGTKPSDSLFSEPEATHWWWFNRHKIFLGWTEYGTTTPMPTIALIDTGFDTDSAAVDRPNYLPGLSITDCFGVGMTSCTTATGDAAALEPPGNPNNDSSHGTTVASVLGSPKNGVLLAGAAPNAPIYPIRVMKPNGDKGFIDRRAVATAIRHAAGKSNIDVISMSLSNNNMCPFTMQDDNIRTEIGSAISAGKILVAAAGNNLKNLQDSSATGCAYSSTAGEIVVGGLDNDTSVSPARTKGWNFGWSGSNYDTTSSIVDISAAANDIRVAWFNPSSSSNPRPLPGHFSAAGTSLATPMVAATAGMMKKLGLASSPVNTLSHANIKSILIGTADISRYTGGYTSNTETNFLGANLAFKSGSKMIGARSLNALNALKIAKHMKQYQVIVRLHNVDDIIWATVNNDWSTGAYMEATYGRDALWGLNGLSPGNGINFYVYNGGSGNAHGYAVFRNSELYGAMDAGVSGVSGADGNITKPTGWSDGYTSTY